MQRTEITQELVKLLGEVPGSYSEAAYDWAKANGYWDEKYKCLDFVAIPSWFLLPSDAKWVEHRREVHSSPFSDGGLCSTYPFNSGEMR